MIYFLTHLGCDFPAYIEYCVKQIIKKDSNFKIYICGDTEPKFIKEKYTFINSRELDIPTNSSYMVNDPNPLWRNSILRIFAINSFMQKENIEGIIHFDNDVMVYEDFTKIQNKFGRKNFITPHKHTEYSFGFSYLNNKDDFNILTQRINELINLGENNVRKLTGDETHEMRLLNFCGKDLIEPLPVHPAINNMENFIFDPSSYGQYIGGTPNGHAPGFIDKTQLVGSHFKVTPHILYSKKEDIFYYGYNNELYKIFNLHVHSKNLKNFYNET
jgi:hypothetical protein